MPLLVHENISPSGEYGIWRISESREYFLARLEMTNAELEHYKTIKGNLQIEWLASRYLLHKMSGRKIRGRLYKDEYGKPHLEDSNYHISMSHSKDMAAVIASPIVCGIDIQLIVPKIEQIAPKFMNTAEFNSLDKDQILHMHLYWGAKECLYKSYGKRKLDFKKHILIEPFPLEEEAGTFNGWVVKDDFKQKYVLQFQRYEDYILVYSTQSDTHA